MINTAARTGWDVEFRFSDLPGRLGYTGAVLNYGVSNRDCVPMDYKSAFGGVRLSPTYRLVAPVNVSEDGGFDVRLWEDALIDENYFGLGKCHWTLESIAFTFSSVNGADFVAAIPADVLRKGEGVTLKFLVSDFPVRTFPNPEIFGEAGGFYPEEKPQFSLRAVFTQAGTGGALKM